MTWRDIGGIVAGAAPTVGSFLLGPAGEKIGALVASALGVEATPDAVADALKNNPDALVKVKEIEANRQIELAKIALGETAEETKQVQAINETMRAESASPDKWAARWRPFWGFTAAVAFGVVVIFSCFLSYRAFIMQNQLALEFLPRFLSSMWELFSIPGAILGVASWHRGKMQRIKAGEGGK